MKKSKSTETEAVLDQPITDVLEQEQPAVEASETETPKKEFNLVEELTNRRTGFWELALDEADIKWIKNQCNSKFSFVGPNEAFMLMNCYLGFTAALSRHEQAVKAGIEPGPFSIQAIALEACALMINRFEGSGMESAQRIFRIAVALNGPISEMKKLDEHIEMAKSEQGADSVSAE
jgi:hypothetical protein